MRDDVTLLVDNIDCQRGLYFLVFGDRGANPIDQVLVNPELGNDPAAAGLGNL